MNVWDVVLAVCVVALVALAVWLIRRSRRRGCGCGCGSCPYAGDCERR